MAIIKIENLTKLYGKVVGIKNLNLEIESGEIFGFLGPNGAGKTTTIRTILHLIKPTAGKISIFGQELTSSSYPSILQNIGYLPGEINLYENMTGEQIFRYTKNIYPRSKDDYAKEIIERLEINLQRKFKKLSSGNKQKIGILLALFHRPKLIILDEPTTGLDPLAQNEFYKLLKELKEAGHTIFFSSHNLPEVEKICSRIGIIKNGSLVEVETIEQLKAHRRKVVDIHFAGDFVLSKFKALPGVEIITANDRTLTFYATNQAINPLLHLLADYKIADLNFNYPDLEKVFLKYYEKK